MADSNMGKKFPATVVKVIDEYTVVINRGADHGITKGDAFLIYFIEPEELIDPDTGDSLGQLEIIRGTASATHVQAKMATIKSNRFLMRGKVVRKHTGAFAALSGLGNEVIEAPEKEDVPFDDVELNDKVKPI
jgi:hypothetical protein